MVIKVGLTGGIGSGKSSLARHFRDSGVPHYDSDRRAKELMNSDAQLRKDIVELLGDSAYVMDLDGSQSLNRGFVAEQIFGDEAKRDALNKLVHPAVIRDFEQWVASKEDAAYVIFESAILFDAELEKHFDKTVAVLAPEELRLMRVVNRDGCTMEQAKGRMDAQLSEDELHKRADYAVVNIFEEELEGAAKRLDQIFRYEAVKANK
ncbi:MAG: dephospho-CoA kinase [Rikenellaceae bacterium]